MSRLIFAVAVLGLLFASNALALSCVKSKLSPEAQLAAQFQRSDLVAKLRPSETYASYEVLRLWKGNPSARVVLSGFPPSGKEFIFFGLAAAGTFENAGVCLQVENPEQVLQKLYGAGKPPSNSAVPFLGFLLLFTFLALASIGFVMWSVTHNKRMQLTGFAGS
ncbi:MAG: hypothetical protein AB8B96_04730 [Lysobacterales bacterium]